MCNANNAMHLYYLCIYYMYFFLRMITDRDHLNALHYFADKSKIQKKVVLEINNNNSYC